MGQLLNIMRMTTSIRKNLLIFSGNFWLLDVLIFLAYHAEETW